MQRGDSDAESRYRAVDRHGDQRRRADDGSRALSSRRNNYNQSARELAARAHKFIYRPADPERFYDMLLLLANDAAQDRQWQTAYNIASQIDDALARRDGRQRSAARRARQLYEPGLARRKVALDRLNRAKSAVAMFDRYGRGGRSLQVQTKGFIGPAARRSPPASSPRRTSYFQRAAAYPELFYGQLALERLGRSVSAPPQALPQYTTTAAQRAAFNSQPPRAGGAGPRPAGAVGRAGLVRPRARRIARQ